MAKGKKLSAYQDLNPLKISKLSEKEQRKAYTVMRDVLRKRNDRLVNAGKPVFYPTPPKIKDVPTNLLQKELAEMARVVRDPRSSLKGQMSREAKASMTLAEHNYHVAPSDMEAFGRYMEATRKKRGARYKGYNAKLTVGAYEELRRLGVPGKTLARSFKKWFENEDKLSELVTAAQNLAKLHPETRVTGEELKQVMKGLS